MTGLAAVFVLFAGHEYLSDRADANPVPLAYAVYWSAAEWLTWVPVVPLVWRWGRRHSLLDGMDLRKVAYLAAGGFAAAAVAIVVQFLADWAAVTIAGTPAVSLRTWLARPPEGPNLGSGTAGSLQYFLFRKLGFSYFVYWFLLLGGYVVAAVRRDRARRLRAGQLEAQLAEARLDSLRYQLNPHFLFNALNSIAEMVHIDRDRADTLIGNLSDLLRRTLKDAGPLVTLAQELSLVESYVAIERARFPRLVFERVVGAELLDSKVPPLLLQTLVENAIRHGVSRNAGGGHVVVRGATAPGVVVLEVEDSGAGNPLPHLVPGVGIRNTKERLAALFGPSATLVLLPSPMGGLLARVTIPVGGAGLDRPWN